MTLSIQLNPNGANVTQFYVNEFNYECKVANHICYGWFYTSIAFSGSYANKPTFYIPDLPDPLISNIAFGYIYRSGSSIGRTYINSIKSGGLQYDICNNKYNIEFNYIC